MFKYQVNFFTLHFLHLSLHYIGWLCKYANTINILVRYKKYADEFLGNADQNSD